MNSVQISLSIEFFGNLNKQNLKLIWKDKMSKNNSKDNFNINEERQKSLICQQKMCWFLKCGVTEKYINNNNNILIVKCTKITVNIRNFYIIIKVASWISRKIWTTYQMMLQIFVIHLRKRIKWGLYFTHENNPQKTWWQ